MKHTVRKNHRELYVYRPKYPNAASREYYRQKVLDAVTAVVSVIGFLSAIREARALQPFAGARRFSQQRSALAQTGAY